MLSRLATVLNTTEANAMRRAAAMRLLPKCMRCGGCGRHSFNGSHSICYGCGGNGQRTVTERDLVDVVAAAEVAVVNGKLDEYLRFLDASKITKNAADRLMKAWQATGISAAYKWQAAAQGVPHDRAVADINAKMHAAYDRVETAGNKISAKSPTYHADVIALAAMTEAGLAEIASAKVELDAFLSKKAGE